MLRGQAERAAIDLSVTGHSVFHPQLFHRGEVCSPGFEGLGFVESAGTAMRFVGGRFRQ